MLERSPSLDGLGGFNGKVLLAYAVAWTITCLSLSKGVKLIGRLAYFTATVPYAIIVVLFVRSVTLDGAIIGMDFYLFKPDMSILWQLSVSFFTKILFLRVVDSL